MVEHQAQTLDVTGCRHGFFELADDLRFAEYHRVDARNHTKDMTSRFALFVDVYMRLKIGRAHALEFFDELKNGISGTLGVDCRAIDFRAVAGRQNHGFRDTAGIRGSQAGFDESDGFSGIFRTEGNALTHRKRSGLMVKAETKQLHGVNNNEFVCRLRFVVLLPQGRGSSYTSTG